MNARVFTGSGVALTTPFTQDSINLSALGKLIEWQIESGSDALIACGTTGEPSTMTEEEKLEVIRFTVDTAAGRVPVIAGVGGNDTRETVAMSIKAQALGADGLLAVTPYYNKTTQRGLVAHFLAIAEAVELPIIIYNVPVRTGLNMLPETLCQLSQHPNICGMKEASADITQITEMMRLCGERIALYSGCDDHVLPLLSLGGQGVISVVADIAPREMHDLVATFLAGDTARSRELQFRLNPLTKQLFTEVNPIPVKTALRLMGYDMGPLRLPLVDMAEANLTNLTKAMKEFGLL